jgi:hypothetical protein
MAALVSAGNVTTARTVLYALAQLERNRTGVGGAKAGNAMVTRAVRTVLDQLVAWTPELTTDLSLTATITTDGQV